MSNNTKSTPRAADRIRDEPESVWVEFIQLALDYKPLNLGQGFPDFAAPKYLIDSLHKATATNDSSTVLNNQYTRSFGHPRLVRALTTYYREFRAFDKLTNPNEQVLVTVGAYEALFAALMAFVNPGDEVILVDPAFDAYAPIVELAQGRSVFVPLRQVNGSSSGQANQTSSSAGFAIDLREMEAKMTAKTRVLVLNTPNNPLGKMYSRRELEGIADLCIRHNILVIADEVYEQMYYAPDEHLSIASLPGMWNRTLTVGSAGKTFSVTGWKVGWALGAGELVRYVQLVHQTSVYTVATPLQEAIARALEHEMELLGRAGAGSSGYWAGLRADLLRKRDRMAAILERAQMRPIVPQGGYFMLADFGQLARRFPQYEREGVVAGRPNSNDYKFVRWMSRERKLQGIPASAFYSAANKHLAANLIRFCFIKEDATLDKLEALIGDLMGGAAQSSDAAANANANSGPKSELGSESSSSANSSSIRRSKL